MRCPTLAELPPPPPGRTGWPWTQATPPLDPTPERPAAWPRVTIVTPSFNQAEFLEETIRSVLLQGYPDLEYVIVDGGSTDGSVEIIRKYEKHLAGWVSERDKGQSHAINKGFARSTGQLHGYLASDDLLEPGALQRVAGAMRDGPGWVVGQVRYRQEGVPDRPLPAYPERSFATWFLFCPVPQPGCFWSADLHREMGPFREDLHYYFDYEYWLRMRFRKGIRPLIVGQELAVYRLHGRSKTVSQNQGFEREGRLIHGEYEPLLTRGQRARLWLARRRWRAKRCGGSALSLAAAGRLAAAARKLLHAAVLWPPVFLEPEALAALRRKALAGRAHSNEPAPFVWGRSDL